MTRLPNFLIIGAARSGSTLLSELLAAHPDVFMSEPKEPHFLAFEGRQVAYEGPGDDSMINSVAVTGRDQWLSLFRGAGDPVAIGEASVSTLYDPRGVVGVARHVPDARLIAVLRNPVDRAYSAYCLMRARMLEPESEFEVALVEERGRIERGWHHIWHYANMGRYASQLERFYEAFPRDQIRVYLFEDLVRSPDRVVSEAMQFIGVDPRPVGGKHSSAVPSGMPRSPALQSVLMAAWRHRSVLRRAIPNKLQRTLWRALNGRNLAKVPLPRATRARLSAEFEEEIDTLERLLDRNLDIWRSNPTG